MHRDIIHLYMFDDSSHETGLTARALNGQADARVIHFEDDDDLWDFYDSIPYEQSWTPQNLVSEFRPVCSGAAGQAFLNQLRITRAIVTSDDHSFCNRFDPTAKTTREQIATMVARAVNYLEVRKSKDITPLESDVSKFTDQSRVSDWAAEAMGTLAANGIMAGTSPTTLSPKNACTIEQSILLVYRVYEKCQAAT